MAKDLHPPISNQARSWGYAISFWIFIIFFNVQAIRGLYFAARPFSPPQSAPHFLAFVILLCFRYCRSIVHTVAFYFGRPDPIPASPSYRPSEVTVLLQTADLRTPVLNKAMKSMLEHPFKELIICSGGSFMTDPSREQHEFARRYNNHPILLLHNDECNRRAQVVMSLKQVKTPFFIITDDHCFWPSPSTRFIESLLAPFENPFIGAVVPMIQVQRKGYPFPSWKGFWNYIGMTYIVRRYQEYIATNTIDGGIGVVGDRFCVFRTEIFRNRAFYKAYLNERILFGCIGPLNVDDDKFTTRWLFCKGYGAKVQCDPDIRVETELGEWPKFAEQIMRWTRTTYRSAPRHLTMERGLVWMMMPWTAYAYLVYGLFRFALFQEIALFWTLRRGIAHEKFPLAATLLGLLIVGMKIIKLLPHFRRHPKDLVYLPMGMLFAYACSFTRTWAMLSFWDISWGTAKKAGEASAKPPSKKEIAVKR